MVKRICTLLLALFLLLPCVQTTFVFADTASTKKPHDKIFEEIVFGDKKVSDTVASSVKNIEYAAYLCIDLSYGKADRDSEKLETLKKATD